MSNPAEARQDAAVQLELPLGLPPVTPKKV